MDYFLNYPGEVDEIIGKRLGPNLNGEYFVAVHQMYDPNSNITVVGFRKVDVEA